MSIRYDYDRQRRLLSYAPYADVGIKDLRAHLAQIESLEKLEQTGEAGEGPLKLLCDLGGVESFDLSQVHAQRYAEAHEEMADSFQPVHIAVLVGNPLQFGFARMFQSLIGGEVVFKIFEELEEAKTWLFASPIDE